MRRKPGSRKYRPVVIIICQGAKTEYNYFINFRKKYHPKVEVEVIPGKQGENLEKLLKKAKFQKNEKLGIVWLVIDKDQEPPERFDEIIQKAHRKGIGVAYSNVCFELWYCLHYSPCKSRLTAKGYCQKLSKELGKKYIKEETDMFTHLENLQADATKNAEALYEDYDEKIPHSQRNPCTTVHRLVEELNELFAKNK